MAILLQPPTMGLQLPNTVHPHHKATHPTNSTRESCCARSKASHHYRKLSAVTVRKAIQDILRPLPNRRSAMVHHRPNLDHTEEQATSRYVNLLKSSNDLKLKTYS